MEIFNEKKFIELLKKYKKNPQVLGEDPVYTTNNAVYWIAVKSVKILNKLGCLGELEKELNTIELMNYYIIKQMRLKE